MSTGFLRCYQPGGNFNLDTGVPVQHRVKGLSSGLSDRSHGVRAVSVNQKGEGPHVERIPISPYLLDCEDRVDRSFRTCSAKQGQDSSNKEKTDGQQKENNVFLVLSEKEKQCGDGQDRGKRGPEKHASFYQRECEWWQVAFAIFGFLGAVALLVFTAQHGISSFLFRADFDGFVGSVVVWFYLFVIWDTLAFLAMVYLPYSKIGHIFCVYWWGFVPLWLWPLVLHLCLGNWAILAGMFFFQLFWTLFCWSCGASVSLVPLAPLFL